MSNKHALSLTQSHTVDSSRPIGTRGGHASYPMELAAADLRACRPGIPPPSAEAARPGTHGPNPWRTTSCQVEPWCHPSSCLHQTHRPHRPDSPGVNLEPEAHMVRKRAVSYNKYYVNF